MTAAEIAARLGNGKEQKNGAGWVTLCLAHDDHNPSLLVNDKTDGGITVKCLAGCDWRAVREELTRRGMIDAHTPKQPATPTGREDHPRWIYRSASYNPVGLVERIDKGPGDKSFCQYRRVGDAWVKGLDKQTLPLYRLPETLGAIQAGRTIYVCEGEKCADALVRIGMDATTSPGGAGKWKPEYSEDLRGARVVILPDNDEPGRKHAEMVARSLAGFAADVKVVPLPGLPAKGDIFDFIAAGGTREQIEALAVARAETPEDLFVSAGDLLADESEPAQIVEGVIEAATVGQGFGPTAGGKSFVFLGMGLHIAAGIDWAGRKVKAGPVVYIAGEGKGGIKRRVRAWVEHHELPGPPADLHISKMRLAFDSATVGRIEAAIEKIGTTAGNPVLIVVDTLARALPDGADENSSQDTMSFIGQCDRLRDRFGCVVLIVHHSGHGEGTKGRARGSSALKGAMDFEIRVDPTESLLTCTKAKDLEPFAPIPFRLLTVGNSCVATYPPAGEILTRKSRQGLTASEQLASQTLLEAVTHVGNWYGDWYGVHVEEWRRRFYSKHTGDNPETKRKAFNRVREALTVKREVEVLDDVYRPTNFYPPTQAPAGQSGTNRDIVPVRPGTKRDTPLLKGCPVPVPDETVDL